MKSLPKISFVIPTYNRANMILDALQSLKEQTAPEWEAIVVDDHSTDNLKEVVKNFDPRVHCVRLPDNRGRGVSCARNYGNLLAKAELIAVLDSDDLAKPKRAELALKSYAEHRWDFYCARRETLYMETGEFKPQKVSPDYWDSELFKTYSFVSHCTVVYTKKAALEIPYNSALTCLDDYDLISRFMELGKSMFLDPVSVAIYRKHGNGSITDNVSTDNQEVLLDEIRTWRGWK